jgi:hypothetical protein
MKIFRGLFSTILIIARIFVMFKFLMLLWLTIFHPKEYPTSVLTWLVYYMVFDMWMVLMLPNEENNPQNDDENSSI